MNWQWLCTNSTKHNIRELVECEPHIAVDNENDMPEDTLWHMSELFAQHAQSMYLLQ